MFGQQAVGLGVQAAVVVQISGQQREGLATDQRRRRENEKIWGRAHPGGTIAGAQPGTYTLLLNDHHDLAQY